MNLWRRIVHIILIAFALHSVALAQESLSDEVLIKLKPAAAFPNTRGYIKSAHAAGLLSQNRAWSHLNIHHLKLAPGLSLANAITNIKTDPDVEYVEPNYIVKADQLQQFGLLGGSGFSQSSAPIKVDEAWSILTTDLPRTVVAIIDTGVDTSHEVFAGSESIWVNPNEIPGNGIDDDGNGYVDDVNGWNFVSKNNSPMDDQGHGTHVAGIVLGVTQNIFANPLEKSKILLMPLKFLDSQGSGTTSDAIDAITYAIKNGAHVLNNSWGGTGASQALLDAIKHSKSTGRSFVAAAGNQSNDNDSNPTYPASYAVENIIAVAATTDSDAFADFSNFGFKTVHMGAPGQDIKSTLPSDAYGTSSGTSMATPFVAGTAALMIREKSFLDGVRVRNLILGGTDKITSLSGRVSTEGRLNVYNSVVAAQNATETSSSTLSSSDDNTIYEGAILGGGCGLVKSTSNGSRPGPSGLVALVLLLMPLFAFLALRRRCLYQD